MAVSQPASIFVQNDAVFMLKNQVLKTAVHLRNVVAAVSFSTRKIGRVISNATDAQKYAALKKK